MGRVGSVRELEASLIQLWTVALDFFGEREFPRIERDQPTSCKAFRRGALFDSELRNSSSLSGSTVLLYRVFL
jgi:hypothetical protein